MKATMESLEGEIVAESTTLFLTPKTEEAAPVATV
jgi:hypothetical protein